MKRCCGLEAGNDVFRGDYESRSLPFFSIMAVKGRDPEMEVCIQALQQPLT